ncbi:MAG: hypothetical protein ACT4QB_20220, partial [Gammaproteobacteria bacterium]
MRASGVAEVVGVDVGDRGAGDLGEGEAVEMDILALGPACRVVFTEQASLRVVEKMGRDLLRGRVFSERAVLGG